MAETISIATLLQPYFKDSSAHWKALVTKQLRAHFKDKQVLPFVGIPAFEYLDDAKNKKVEQITLKWNDKISLLQWENPGIQKGSGDLVDEVLCGIATVTHKAMNDFDIVKVPIPRCGEHIDPNSKYYHALVFGQEMTEGEARVFLAKVAKWGDMMKNRDSRALWTFDGNDWYPDLTVLRDDSPDLVLEGKMKEHIEKDMGSFFESEKRYNDLQVPWKRGLLFIGPPGNGKTRMIKVTALFLYFRSFDPNKLSC
jgi:hypothetical protein